jgi:hypothetical protein
MDQQKIREGKKKKIKEVWGGKKSLCKKNKKKKNKKKKKKKQSTKSVGVRKIGKKKKNRGRQGRRGGGGGPVKPQPTNTTHITTRVAAGFEDRIRAGRTPEGSDKNQMLEMAQRVAGGVGMAINISRDVRKSA